MQDIEKLQQLDGEKITKEEKRDAGYIVSSDSEEEEEEDDDDNEVTTNGEGTIETEAVLTGRCKLFHQITSFDLSMLLIITILRNFTATIYNHIPFVLYRAPSLILRRCSRHSR